MSKRILIVLVVALVAVLMLFFLLHTGEQRPCPFSIEVSPGHIRDSIPGQSCLFLVEVHEDDKGGEDKEVIISATAPGAEVTVNPPAILPGQVAEVMVVPGEGRVGENITVTVTGKRMVEETATATIKVNPGVDDIREAAEGYRDMFVPWLESSRPELGITSGTAWNGTIVTPNILVVMHYLFLSEEWEMHLCWHVMIEPHNWARIDLRRRFEEVVPSLAFEIPSVTGSEGPREIEPPDEVRR
jgi:hypothetical protein